MASNEFLEKGHPPAQEVLPSLLLHVGSSQFALSGRCGARSALSPGPFPFVDELEVLLLDRLVLVGCGPTARCHSHSHGLQPQGGGNFQLDC